MSFSIALYRPQIPPNLGNIARLSVALDLPLDVVGKTPIRWDEPSLKRAGLDHWDDVRFSYYPRFKEFYLKYFYHRIVAVTKSAQVNHWDFEFTDGDVLLFGNEQKGLPPSLLKRVPHQVKIPMWGENVRSLNLSNAVAVVSYEAMRRLKGAEKLPPEGQYPRTWYQKREKR